MAADRTINIAVNTTGNAGQQVLTLRQQVREATIEMQTLAAQPIVDEAALQASIANVAQLRDRMNDANEQVGVLTAGSPWEKLSNSIGDVGSKLMSLDFEGAKESAERMIEITKTISFKDAIASAKDFGKTMISLGRAILTNPLFLIAAVIAGIVFVIYKLLDALGVIKMAFDAIKEVVGAVVQAFKDLTDWMGITDNAGQELADNQIKAAQEMSEAHKISTDKVIGDLDREISRRQANGQATTKLEQQKQLEIANGAKKEIDAKQQEINAIYKKAKIAGEITEEQTKQIKDLMGVIRSEVEIYKNANTEFDNIRDKARIKTAEDEAKQTENEKKENDKRVADNKKAYEKRLADQAAYNAKRLQTTRQIEDIENSLILDQAERETEINKDKYRRLREDAIADTKLLGEERKVLLALYAEQEAADQAKINDAKKERDQKVISDEKKKREELDAFLKNLETNKYKREDQAIKDELVKNKEFLDDRKAMEEKSDKDAVATGKMTKEKAAAEALIREEQYEADLIKVKEAANAKQVELRQIADDATKEELQERLDAELISEQEYADRVAALKKKAETKSVADAIELEKEKWLKKIDITEKYTAAAGSLANSLLTISENIGKKDEKTQKEQAKRRFKVEKAFALVTTGIETAKNIVKVFPNPVAMGIAAAVGAAALIAIASKQFDGGETSASSGVAAPSAPSDVNTTQASTPSFNLFGTGGSANNVSGANNGGPSTSNNNNNIGVTVSITEIEDTSKKVSKINENATL